MPVHRQDPLPSPRQTDIVQRGPTRKRCSLLRGYFGGQAQESPGLPAETNVIGRWRRSLHGGLQLISDHLLELGRERVSIEHKEQVRDLDRAFDDIAHRFNMNGVLRSGMFAKAIAELCANAIAERAQVTWQTLSRFIKVEDMSDAGDLENVLRKTFRELLGDCEDIRAYFEKARKVSCMGDRGKELEKIMDTRTDLSVKRIDGEIGLFVHSAKSGSETRDLEGTNHQVEGMVMILGKETLRKLRNLINEETEYRSGPMLVAFFQELGFEDSYGQDFPSRSQYTDEKLAQINGTPNLIQCIRNLFCPRKFIEDMEKLDGHISDLNQHLAFDKWRMARNQAELTFQELKTVEIDEASDGGGQVESEIGDADLAKLGLGKQIAEIISYRLSEIDRCYSSNAPLAVIFLAGSTLEGILLGIAMQYPKEFNQTKTAPKDGAGRTREFKEWKLNAFLNAVRELCLIQEDTFQFSNVLRDFRNYIHPLEQLQSGFSPGMDTANLCLQVLQTAIRQIGENAGRLRA